MATRFLPSSGGRARAIVFFCFMVVVWMLPTQARALPEQSSTPDDIPGMVAVDLEDSLSQPELEAFGSEFGVSLSPSSILSARTRIHAVTVARENVHALLERLRKDGRVQHVEPVAKVHARWVPNDPLFQEQWHIQRVGAIQAWQVSTGRGVTVAVVDTGVACENHEAFTISSDLADTWCKTGFNFVDNHPHATDDHGHGTHVAGTIAQSTHNGIGGSGLAFHARLLPIKVLNAQGWGTTLAVADGVRYAADAGAHVINLSLGGARASRILFDAIQYARSKGALVVAAAGNNGQFVEYPAAFEGVVAVAATDSQDRLASFSSWGPEVDLAAPGENVLQQTICNGGKDRCELFSKFSGTSMAAPHVSAAAALLMSLGVTEPGRVQAMLEASAEVPEGEIKGGPRFGQGIVQVGKAVRATVGVQAATRLALVFGLTAYVGRRIRRKGGFSRFWRPGFWLMALAFGPGLLAWAPIIVSRVSLPIDLLARPVPDWDLLLGVSVHRWLPLAHVLIPFSLSAVGFGIRWARPFIAGIAVGIAAYLGSVPLLELTTGNLISRLLLATWALINIAGCLWLAVLHLDEREVSS
ncbi:MAG TPA: S8 family peptidase [Polyangiaceae bacterium]|jgi:serine protease|nr:MAG: Thermophilic serine proteinase precursor [Deltaproteobacteria bacterium ADurb.Bin207]HNZ25186.1 S8 family peptidase [Polyangiaceae bacterium]HOD24976.1 S8 family peptidase [Polyangiaceae bacterium]HOE50634.1 S8 family peptidase [Polyangiaceae bacterium]HOH03289.1 S8 family peptidase [Polyangiaceae bacterium]